MPKKKKSKTQLSSVPDAELEFYDAPRLVWVRVSDAVNLLWEDNPKLHDIGSLIQSVIKHGFQELPKFDINLINVKGERGAIKAGNGRVEVLYTMEKNAAVMEYELPRGLAREKDSGAWVLPLIMGTDAVSTAMVRAYAIDSNNLTMMGGDFTAFDAMKMWDGNNYIDVLTQLGEQGVFPVSVDSDTLDAFLSAQDFDFDQYDEQLDEIIEDKELDIEVLIGNEDAYIDAIAGIRVLLDENPTWQGRIA